MRNLPGTHLPGPSEQDYAAAMAAQAAQAQAAQFPEGYGELAYGEPAYGWSSGEEEF